MADRRLISNDDGYIMGTGPELLTPEIINEQMVATYAESPIDTVSWCVGNSEVYNFETGVGERLGDGGVPLTAEHDIRARRNLDHLVEIAGGPLTEIGRQFRGAGLGFYPSLRMNSHYSIPWGAPGYGRFRREHADCLIGGPDEYLPAPTVAHGIRRGLDYRHPIVRTHMLAIAGELAERFEIDGLELDYMRHPAFFRIDEGAACAYLMTDFLRCLRQRLDKVGTERGQHLDLLVRVPPTLADCLRLGLDVRRWMGEGLVNRVAAGGGFIPFEMPVGEFVDAARGTGCQVYGSFEGLRPALDEDVLCAMAARFWSAGVDGLYLFNYYRTPQEWKRDVLSRLMDRKSLRHARKRYELDHAERVRGTEGHGAAFHHAIPTPSLPVTLEETAPGGGAELTIEIAEDMASAHACVLQLGLRDLGDSDTLEINVNGTALDALGAQRDDGWDTTTYDDGHLAGMGTTRTEGLLLSLAVPATALRDGANQIRVRLLRATAPHAASPKLVEVRLEIDHTTD
jgi:hypothetical protein